MITKENVKHKIFKIGDESSIKVSKLMTSRLGGWVKYGSDEPIVFWRYTVGLSYLLLRQHSKFTKEFSINSEVIFLTISRLVNPSAF
jgi:hypothetical protein